MRDGGKRRVMAVLALVGLLLLVAAWFGLRRFGPEVQREQGPPVAPGSSAEDSPARAGPGADPAPPEAAPSGTILFRVMDRNERTPIGSARVEIEGVGLRLSPSTGAEGLARFADLPAGALLLARISPPDRAPRLRVEYESACVPAGSEEVVEVGLLPAETRNGVVLDTLTGGPIAGARVESRGDPWPESVGNDPPRAAPRSAASGASAAPLKS